jgi:glycosyltransferase involved in cell wall biosynthesis
MEKTKLPISAVILTYNEGKNIEACLESICSWIGEIFIVDSFSTDRTTEIAKRYTNKIYQHPFETHNKQWNWAFKTLPLSFEWCLAVDADQIISEKLQNELKESFKTPSLDINGYYIKRKQIFRGKWIRFGGYYPKYLLKVFKVKDVFCNEMELVDHRFYVQGKIAKLKNDIIERNLNEDSMAFWIEKHSRYATLLAKETISRRNTTPNNTIRTFVFGTPDQRVFWLKGIYEHMPLYIRPFLYFFWRYFICLGFLDGKQGFIFHFFQGLCYRLLVDIEIHRLKTEGNKLI